MTKTGVLIVLLNVVVYGSLAAKFPSDLPQCHAGDTVCLPSTMTKIIAEHPNGHAGLAIPSLEPLRINAIDIIQGADSPIAISLNLKNMDMHGISNAVITKVIGFEKDPLAKRTEIRASLPKLSLTGDYKITGKVLVLPIQGNGKVLLNFENLDILIKYKPRVLTKNGKVYIQTDKFSFNFDTTRMRMDFTNLFNGDKALGDNMNLFLNENWSDILGELKPSISSAFEQIFEQIINRIFAKVPYEDLYLQ